MPCHLPFPSINPSAGRPFPLTLASFFPSSAATSRTPLFQLSFVLLTEPPWQRSKIHPAVARVAARDVRAREWNRVIVHANFTEEAEPELPSPPPMTSSPPRIRCGRQALLPLLRLDSSSPSRSFRHRAPRGEPHLLPAFPLRICHRSLRSVAICRPPWMSLSMTCCSLSSAAPARCTLHTLHDLLAPSRATHQRTPASPPHPCLHMCRPVVVVPCVFLVISCSSENLNFLSMFS